MTTIGMPTAALAASEGPSCAPTPFPQTPGLTKYIVEFVRNTKFSDMPPDVIELGKKSILDGLGLAVAGARAENGKLFRQYMASIGLPDRGVGIGLRTVHYAHIVEAQPDVDWFEILSDNYMNTAGRPLHFADAVAASYPVALHGVG